MLNIFRKYGKNKKRVNKKNSNLPKFITPELFNDFTYCKKTHFTLFKKYNYDFELFGKEIDPLNCDLKVYQDLLIYSYIRQNVSKGSKILEIGGGESRIIKRFKQNYECWNIDKLEGVGFGPVDINKEGFRMIYDYMGNFSKELPDNYFDLVFSVSTLEHVPSRDLLMHQNILQDINRVLKPGSYSVHTMDLIWLEQKKVWTNHIMPYLFENANIINAFIPVFEIIEDLDLFLMSEKFYNNHWLEKTKQSYSKFKPIAYSFLWKKPE